MAARKKEYLILTINPGSTSTKIGLFRNENPVLETTIRHSAKMLERFDGVWDQYSFRKDEIIEAISKNGLDLSELDAVVGRGGLIKPVQGGVYIIDEQMIEDARTGFGGNHASNLGCVIAYSIGWEYNVPTYIADPPSVDEMEPLARVSGLQGLERKSLMHALNIFATARDFAKDKKKKLEDLNLIVAHLGGGITISALRKGKAINSNNGLDEGPFTPERSGKLPMLQFMEMCFSGKYSKEELRKMIVGKGGLVSYFKTNKAHEIENMVMAGSNRFKLVYEAMAYQIAEEIGARATNLKGEIDGIILTGGLANSSILCEWIKERVNFMAPVHIYPGEQELEALALGALRVLRGQENAKQYTERARKIGIYYWESLELYVSAINHIEDRFREKGYSIRQDGSNLEIQYVNCKGSEDKARDAIARFIDEEVDVIFAVGSPASARATQYLKKSGVPVICTGIYNGKVLGNGGKKDFYATCYGTNINDQMKNTVLKISPKIKKMGLLYKIGEMQSDIQHDEVKEFCERNNISLEVYDIQNSDDFGNAAAFFLEKKVEWVYLGADTVTVAASSNQLAEITKRFPTVCTIGTTVSHGGLIAYNSSWRDVARKAADIALQIFNDVDVDSWIVHPTTLEVIANRKTAEELGLFEKIAQIKGVKFV